MYIFFTSCIIILDIYFLLNIHPPVNSVVNIYGQNIACVRQWFATFQNRAQPFLEISTDFYVIFTRKLIVKCPLNNYCKLAQKYLLYECTL